MNLIPIENNKSLYRDTESGAVLNCSSSDYESYLEHKKSLIAKQDEIQNLKDEVSEIKDMMKLILSKLDSNS